MLIRKIDVHIIADWEKGKYLLCHYELAALHDHFRLACCVRLSNAFVGLILPSTDLTLVLTWTVMSLSNFIN